MRKMARRSHLIAGNCSDTLFSHQLLPEHNPSQVNPLIAHAEEPFMLWPGFDQPSCSRCLEHGLSCMVIRRIMLSDDEKQAGFELLVQRQGLWRAGNRTAIAGNADGAFGRTDKGGGITKAQADSGQF